MDHLGMFASRQSLSHIPSMCILTHHHRSGNMACALRSSHMPFPLRTVWPPAPSLSLGFHRPRRHSCSSFCRRCSWLPWLLLWTTARGGYPREYMERQRMSPGLLYVAPLNTIYILLASAEADVWLSA
jgi:hypothetical protein